MPIDEPPDTPVEEANLKPLTPEQVQRAVFLQAFFPALMSNPLSDWLIWFRRSVSPDSCISDYEACAAVFQHICDVVKLSELDRAKLMIAIVMVLQFAREKDIRRHLPKCKGIPNLPRLTDMVFDACLRRLKPRELNIPSDYAGSMCEEYANGYRSRSPSFRSTLYGDLGLGMLGM
jgi:hypothetical protein